MLSRTRLLAFALLACAASTLSGCGGICLGLLFMTTDPPSTVEMVYGGSAELTFNNPASCPLVLELGFNYGDLDFSVTPDSITIPAEGSGTVLISSLRASSADVVIGSLSIRADTGIPGYWGSASTYVGLRAVKP